MTDTCTKVDSQDNSIKRFEFIKLFLSSIKNLLKYSGDAIKKNKMRGELRSVFASALFSKTKNDVFKRSAAFQAPHLNNLESLC